MAKFRDTLLLSAAALLGWAGAAAANTFTINNTAGSTQQTLVEGAALGTGTPDGFFSGSNWGPNVGGPQTGGSLYQTTGLTASYSAAGDGTVTLVFNTNFAALSPSGVDPIGGGRSVFAADIFIKSNATGSALTSAFNFGISLGYTGMTGADGGVCSVGNGSSNCGAALYSVSSSKTSNQIWGAGSGTTISGTYGGGFAPVAAFSGTGTCSTATSTVATCADSEASPTVISGGTKNTDVGVTEAWGADTLTVTLAGDDAAGAADLSSIFSDFDIFWGTGDCSNAPIWGNIAGLTSVPEPSSLALLASAAFGFVAMRRRKRKVSAVG